MKERGTFNQKDFKVPPVFKPHLQFYWKSFWELSTTRNELGPIPWTAINEYCYRWKVIDGQEFDSFIFFIRGLDSSFLKNKQDKIQKQRSAAKSGRR